MVPGKLHVIAASGSYKNANAFRHDFASDSVSLNDRNFVMTLCISWKRRVAFAKTSDMKIILSVEGTRGIEIIFLSTVSRQGKPTRQDSGSVNFGKWDRLEC
jgi:hypothetical protein